MTGSVSCAAMLGCGQPVRAGRPACSPWPNANPWPLSPTTPFPATITAERIVSAQALVAWRGNFYSVPPELTRATVVVAQRLGTQHLDIATVSGIVIARRHPHPAAPA
ncbi:Mu transposase domain-containing protein [Nocardioides immobilis]|uniref:Mu transposase domain-containing protein n=1 Tax=Nocardioides immobilis TaxID=2049295 RepID=UPI001C70B47E|nr:hypothetical protein [Nocardioides immobilis]